jgi:hypothetical protein
MVESNSKVHIIRRMAYFIISIFVLFYSCVHKIDDELPKNNIENISHHNEKRSHWLGEQCTSCHIKGGQGTGWFAVSGSVYDSAHLLAYPNTVMKLFTGPAETGLLIYELEGDSLGNFFTTDTIAFGNGLYPVVYGKFSKISMGSHIKNGNCNGCHGITTNRIKLK